MNIKDFPTANETCDKSEYNKIINDLDFEQLLADVLRSIQGVGPGDNTCEVESSTLSGQGHLDALITFLRYKGYTVELMEVTHANGHEFFSKELFFNIALSWERK